MAIMPFAFLNLGRVRLQAHFTSERRLGLLFAVFGFFRFVFLQPSQEPAKTEDAVKATTTAAQTMRCFI